MIWKRNRLLYLLTIASVVLIACALIGWSDGPLVENVLLLADLLWLFSYWCVCNVQVAYDVGEEGRVSCLMRAYPEPRFDWTLGDDTLGETWLQTWLGLVLPWSNSSKLALFVLVWLTPTEFWRVVFHSRACY